MFTPKRILAIVAALLAGGTSLASENNLPAFQADILKKMNELRARHGVAPLKLSTTLNQYAEARANAISQKGGQPTGHDGLKPGYGENTFYSYSTDTVMFSGTAAAESWYAEQKDFKGDDKSGAAAQFTQMIWKGSSEVGCSRVAKPESTYYSTYIVCVFAPQGNIAGQFAPNVPAVSAVPAKIPSSKRK